jgi:hypothetical protein
VEQLAVARALHILVPQASLADIGKECLWPWRW